MKEDKEEINHPSHYGGKDDTYEAIKVMEAWGLSGHLWSTVKYIARAGKKDNALKDLKKARWYIDRKIRRMEQGEKINEIDPNIIIRD